VESCLAKTSTFNHSSLTRRCNLWSTTDTQHLYLCPSNMTPPNQLILFLSLLSSLNTKSQAASIGDPPVMHELGISPIVRRQGCPVAQWGDCTELAGSCCPAEAPQCCVVNCSPHEWTIDAVEGHGQCCTSGLWCAGGTWCIWDITAGRQKCCPHADVGFPTPCGISDGIWNARYQDPPVPAVVVDYPIPTIYATDAAVPK